MAVSLSVLGALPVFAETTTPTLAISETPSQDLRQTARDYFTAADYDKATESYSALLADKPQDALSLKVDLGLAYKAKKDYAHALPLFAEVASSNSPRKVEALFFTEDCCCEQGKIADAVAVLTRAYKECPEARADVLFRRAARLCGIQKYEEAVADYQELIEMFPERKDMLVEAEPSMKIALGMSQKAKKQYPEAIETFSGIAARYSARAIAAEFLVEDCLSEQQKYDDCTAHLTKMLDEHPEVRAEILMRRAARLGDAGRLQECLADLLTIQNECPERGAEAKLGEGLTRLTIGQQRNDLGELRSGVDILETFKAAEPDEAVFESAARFHLATHYIYFGHWLTDEALCNNPAKGRELLLSSSAELPESMYTWWMKTEAAGSYQVALRYAETAAEVDKLLAQNPPATWEEYLLFLKWHSLVGQKQIKQAEEVVAVLTRKHPSGEWTLKAQERMPVYRQQEVGSDE